MPKGKYPRKPKEVTTASILRENQELRAKNAVLVNEYRDLKFRIAELEVELANQKLTIAKLERNSHE